MKIGEDVEVIQVPKDQPLTAWRGWRVDENDPYRLQSVSLCSKWSRLKRADEVPQLALYPKWAWNNGHGLWAFKTCDDSLRSDYRSDVQGRVKLWGTVVVTERGYRAEHAKIDGLIVRKRWGREDWFAHILGVKRLRLVPVVSHYDVTEWPK